MWTTRRRMLATSAAAIFVATLAVGVVAPPVEDKFDPSTSRDFTDRCNQLAVLAPAVAYCKIFDLCCSPQQALDPLNGDKCQVVDANNVCNYDAENDAVTFKQCRAHNCTVIVTTTTTTTTTTPPPVVDGVGSLLPSCSFVLSSVSVLLISALFSSSS